MAQKFFRCSLIRDNDVAGVFIDDIAPQPLQEALHTDDIACVPRTAGVKWSHRHLVQAEGVGAELVVHLVRSDDVLQALAHLAVLTCNGFAVP